MCNWPLGCLYFNEIGSFPKETIFQKIFEFRHYVVDDDFGPNTGIWNVMEKIAKLAFSLHPSVRVLENQGRFGIIAFRAKRLRVPFGNDGISLFFHDASPQHFVNQKRIDWFIAPSRWLWWWRGYDLPEVLSSFFVVKIRSGYSLRPGLGRSNPVWKCIFRFASRAFVQRSIGCGRDKFRSLLAGFIWTKRTEQFRLKSAVGIFLDSNGPIDVIVQEIVPLVNFC